MNKYAGQYIVLDTDKVEVKKESEAYYKLTGAGWVSSSFTENGNRILTRHTNAQLVLRILI